MTEKKVAQFDVGGGLKGEFTPPLATIVGKCQENDAARIEAKKMDPERSRIRLQEVCWSVISRDLADAFKLYGVQFSVEAKVGGRSVKMSSPDCSPEWSSHE